MRTGTYIILLVQILIYNFVIIIKCDSEVKWIDPFELELTQPREQQSEFKDCNALAHGDRYDVMAYYKRAINLILGSVMVENTDPNTYKGRLFVDMPIEDYKFLKKFTSISTDEPLTLQRVDQILTNILKRSYMDELTDVFIYWSDYAYYMLFHRSTGMILMIIVILIVIYKLLKASYTLYQVMVYLLFLAYVLDVAFTWKRLMQELEINKYADSLKYSKMPADCVLAEMSGWQFFLSYISGANNCREYHKIILYDVFWDVGPLDIIAHQSRVLLSVASNIGIAISKLTRGLMGDLPFPLNIILLPILLLFTLFLIWSVLVHVTDTHIDLNLFHLISIKLKKNKQIKEKSERKSGRYRRELEEIEDYEKEHSKSETYDKKEKPKKNLEVNETSKKQNSKRARQTEHVPKEDHESHSENETENSVKKKALEE